MAKIVTKESGGKTMPIGMTVAEPELQVEESHLEAQILPDGGLNGPSSRGHSAPFSHMSGPALRSTR